MLTGYGYRSQLYPRGRAVVAGKPVPPRCSLYPGIPGRTQVFPGERGIPGPRGAPGFRRRPTYVRAGPFVNALLDRQTTLEKGAGDARSFSVSRETKTAIIPCVARSGEGPPEIVHGAGWPAWMCAVAGTRVGHRSSPLVTEKPRYAKAVGSEGEWSLDTEQPFVHGCRVARHAPGGTTLAVG